MTNEELLALPVLPYGGFDTVEIDAGEVRQQQAVGNHLVICSVCTSPKYMHRIEAGLDHTVKTICQKCDKSTSHVVIRRGVSATAKRLAIPISKPTVVFYHREDDPIQTEASDGSFWTVGWYKGVRYRQRIPRPLRAIG